MKRTIPALLAAILGGTCLLAPDTASAQAPQTPSTQPRATQPDEQRRIEEEADRAFREAERRHDEARREIERAREDVQQRAEQNRARAAEIEQRVRARLANPANVTVWQHAGGKKEKAAYLGVTTSPVSAALRKQLALPRGTGLVVEHVDPESPASQAGLQQYDVLEKLNDQILVNSQQLGVLVRLQKPGDEVTLSVRREGKPQTLRAKLVEKEVLVMDETPWGMPAIAGFAGEAVELPEGAVRVFGEGRFDPDRLRRLARERAANLVWQDDQHVLRVTTKEGLKRLLATDKDGQVLFDGPIDSPEQRKTIPGDILAKLEKLESQVLEFHVPGDDGVQLRMIQP